MSCFAPALGALLFGLRNPEEEDQREEEDDQRPQDEGASHELLKRCVDDRRVRCPVDFRSVAQMDCLTFNQTGAIVFIQDLLSEV